MSMMEVVLPCSIGDTVFLIHGKLEYSEKKRKQIYVEKIITGIVDGFRITKNKLTANIRTEENQKCENAVCGRDYYITYEEAECHLTKKGNC